MRYVARLAPKKSPCGGVAVAYFAKTQKKRNVLLDMVLRLHKKS